MNRKHCALILSLLFAVACGGSSGGQGDDAEDGGMSSAFDGADGGMEPDEGDGDGETPDEGDGDSSSEGDGDGEPPSCEPGFLDCACDEGECAEGQCLDDLCVDCVDGTRDCPCGSGGACEDGLVCGDDQLCALCESGEDGCACDDGECAAGLACENDVCAPPSCAPGTEACPCDDGDVCDDGLFCASNTRCTVCAPNVVGCACADGGCQGGLVCGDDDLCRLPTRCADLSADGTCLPQQDCQEAGSGADAQCIPEACVTGYEWVAEWTDPDDNVIPAGCQELSGCKDLRAAGECVEHQLCDVDADSGLAYCMQQCDTGYDWIDDGTGHGTCEFRPCDPFADVNQIQACSAEYRECVRDPAGVPMCGACKGFAPEDGDGQCQPAFDCPEDPAGACGEGQYCEPGVGCQDNPCPAGQAKDALDLCQACTGVSCVGAGLTGRVWVERDVNGQCVCETQADHYIKSGGAAVAATCDADGDGWVSNEILDPAVLGDDALWHNNRCDVHYVERFQLSNEYHQEREVISCELGERLRLVDVGTETPADCTPVPIALVEPIDIDRPGRPNVSTARFGRNFLASELNALTKACSSVSADFNLDGARDVEQTQDPLGPTPNSLPGRPFGVDKTSNSQVLRYFAYFMELYRGYYLPPLASGELGRYAIAERTRCAEGTGASPAGGRMALDYDGMADDNGYWRSCYRSRDVDYDATQLESGFDFAQFACSSSAGGCSVPPPPLASGVNQPLTRADTGGTVTPHGLCDLTTAPVGAEWLGMNHHSQFQCVVLRDNLPTEPERYQIDANVNEAAFNICSAVVCEGDGSCTENLPDGAEGPNLPAFECTVGSGRPDAPAGDTVGWLARAAMSYEDRTLRDTHGSDGYVRGCIDEAAHWYGLCLDYQRDVDDNGDARSYADCGITMSCTGSAPGTSASGELSCLCNGPPDSQGKQAGACVKRWGPESTDYYGYEFLVWGNGTWN